MKQCNVPRQQGWLPYSAATQPRAPQHGSQAPGCKAGMWPLNDLVCTGQALSMFLSFSLCLYLPMWYLFWVSSESSLSHGHYPSNCSKRSGCSSRPLLWEPKESHGPQKEVDHPQAPHLRPRTQLPGQILSSLHTASTICKAGGQLPISSSTWR